MTGQRPLHQRIWDIAWPAILSNISLPLLGLVDTAILGHLENTHYVGAVAIGASLLAFVYWGFGFLRMGTTGLVAKAFGAGDSETEVLVLLQSGVLALVLALLVVLLHPWWLALGLQFMQPGPDIAPLAASYAGLRIYSAPAVLVTYAIVGWFIGRQNTRWPMAFVIVTNILNILLDLLFIIDLDMKSDGAALATLCAEYVGCALALGALVYNLEATPASSTWLLLRRLSSYRQLLASNQYLFLRTMCLLFSFAFFTAMSTRMGNNTLAANTIMLNLLIFAAYALDGFAYAAEALSGHALGGRRLQEFYQVARLCGYWSLVTALALSGILLIANPVIFPLFTNHAEVQLLLLEYRHWMIVMPLLAAASYLLDGIFIGAAMSRYMMYSMVFSLFVVYLPAWYLLQGFGNTGLWAAFTAFNTARGISLGMCFWHLVRSGGWLDSDSTH
jgi:MATE family multidrug resistance protein